MNRILRTVLASTVAIATFPICLPPAGFLGSDPAPGPVVSAPAAPSAAPSPVPTVAPTQETAVPGAVQGREPVWAQEFDGPAGRVDTGVWKVMDLAGGWGNNELQAYTPREKNVRIDGNGLLRITAHRESHVDPRGQRADYTSARLETQKVFRYGTIQARMNVPAGQGLWSAFWTLGVGHWTTGWPKVGEIDIVELLNDNKVAHGGVHAATESNGHWTQQGRLREENSFAGSWHVYGIEWDANSIRFFVDGVQFHAIERSQLAPGQVWAFDNPQHLIVNLAVGGNWPGSPNDSTPLPAELLVDWIRVYDSEVITP